MELLYILLVIVGVFVALLWILLPFAVFGMKEKLDEIIKELKQINEFFKTKIK
jgi:branched-subunit amino acid transport protein AzlD